MDNISKMDNNQPEQDKLKQLLLSKKTELINRIEQLEQESSRQNNPLSADFEEQAVERESEDVLGEQTRVARVELNDVKTALERLASGTYGVCGECGDSIPHARLKALPMASYCTDCQEYVDQANKN